MSAEAAQVTDEGVATPSGDEGAEVWCPNGCGNRILELGEKIGFPCPACSTPMTVEKPEAAKRDGKKVRLPEVGRIVHVQLAADTVRPAIVMGRNADGRCLVHVFKDDHDPTPPGLYSGDAVLGYGFDIGQWHWPPKAQAEQFDHFE